MQGGAGNDTYIVDNISDVIIENAAEGIDLVQSSVSFTLAANIENITLTGSSAINATGNALDNLVTGNSGINMMAGGAGNDIYVVNLATDVVTELANEGIDTIQSAVTLTLGSNIENLTLTGTTAINATGNTLDNVLTGNSGNNTLTSGAGNDTLDGGTGNDSMLGGAGNDTYIVNIATDVVTELVNEGIDTIMSAVTWTLGANVENITLTGTTAINATGNILDNLLTGNSGKNTLTGRAGNDTYVVNISTDVVTELANEGTDTVLSAVTWTLGTNVENLTLTDTTAINGTGNTLNNILIGNVAANTLTGAAGNDTLNGGAGLDTLIGGAGADTYQFNVGYGTDTIQENDTTIGVVDVVQLLGTIKQADVRFTQAGNNLEMSLLNTTDKLVLQNWYLGGAYHVEQFRFSDGTVLTDTQAQGLVGMMAAFSVLAASAQVGQVQNMAVRPSQNQLGLLAVNPLA